MDLIWHILQSIYVPFLAPVLLNINEKDLALWYPTTRGQSRCQDGVGVTLEAKQVMQSCYMVE